MDSSPNGGIRIVAIGGSVRPGNYTLRALRLVVDELQAEGAADVTLVDPARLDLALPGLSGGSDAESLRETVAAATGVVLATPEYHGSYSSVIKLVIDNLGFPSALAGKPVALLGVAAGRIGAIKAIEHLSSVCTHVGGLVLPGAVSVAEVRSVIDEDGATVDPAMEKRIRGMAHNLMEYIRGHICPKIHLEAMAREGTQVDC